MTRDEFLARLAITFGQPDTADEALFIENYEAVIGITAPRVLDVAFSIIRDEHEFRTWPMPAVVKRAIASAALRVHGPARPNEPEQNPRANPSPESRKRVADLVGAAVETMGLREKSGGVVRRSGFPFAEVQAPAFRNLQHMSMNQPVHRRGLSRSARGA